LKDDDLIYFLRHTAEGYIKIGSTVNMKRRVTEHYLDFGRPACILGVMKGTRGTESYLHGLFYWFKVPPRLGFGNEWFLPVPEILNFIEEAYLPS
jgi:hypothetical protein